MQPLSQALVVLGIAFFVYNLPYFVLIFHSFTPFKVMFSPIWHKHMDWRRSFRPIYEPTPLPEIDYKDLTYEKFVEMTGNLSRPIVIRNALKVDHLQKLTDVDFWRNNYGNSTITCIEMPQELYKGCTVNEFLDHNLKEHRNVYSRTNHQILYENEELLDMLKNDVSQWIGSDPLYEIFIGFKDGGSPLHAAFGINLFKQITGRKKWTLWAPSELPFMNLHLSDDAASLLAIGTPTMSDAEWLKRTKRYEIIVRAGDMLFNPCMWMHIVENLPGDNLDSMVVGAPERYFGLQYGWKTSSFVTTHLILKKILIKIYQKVNGIKAAKTAVDFLPINNKVAAKAFDEYIRNRAIELTGAEFK